MLISESSVAAALDELRANVPGGVLDPARHVGLALHDGTGRVARLALGERHELLLAAHSDHGLLLGLRDGPALELYCTPRVLEQLQSSREFDAEGRWVELCFDTLSLRRPFQRRGRGGSS